MQATQGTSGGFQAHTASQGVCDAVTQHSPYLPGEHVFNYLCDMNRITIGLEYTETVKYVYEWPKVLNEPNLLFFIAFLAVR